MKKELKKITDLTINHLLNNNIILPSTYFDKFNYYAKDLEIELDSETFKKEINNIIIEDFKSIEKYMHSIFTNATNLQEYTKDAKNALLKKDTNSLKDINKKILLLEKEITNLNNQLFLDDITNTYNKKWIYYKLLDDDYEFKEDGVCVLMESLDYYYIQKEYGALIGHNLLIFTSNFITQKLKDEKFNFNIVRYNENKFLIFLLDTKGHEKHISNFFSNFEKLLSIMTLKNNMGCVINAKFKFEICEFKAQQEAKEIFNKLISQEIVEE